MRSRIGYGLIGCGIVLSVLSTIGWCAVVAPTPDQELKARVEAATKDLKDLSMLATVVEVDKKSLEKLDPAYARLMELQAARICMKPPDRMKIEGKLGMVKFEYIVNAGFKITRAPMVRFKRKEDYSGEPAKLQWPLDVGLVTPSLWSHRRVEVMDDPDATANGEIVLRLRWLKGDMSHVVWIDAQNLWLKKIEKRDARECVEAMVVYSNPKNIGGKIWMPTAIEMYASDGSRAGKSEISDIKYNMGLQDSVFE